ncbi:MAG: hypothetical protein DHS20C15_06720 [Planctomycetota bacterium]|nr:MAG: hypothetical protein DHS20C15_06720 [Planctomycetota bacterium]
MSLWLGALALLVLPGKAAAQLTPADEVVDGLLQRREGGQVFEALAGRVSVQPHDLQLDLSAALTELASRDARLANLSVLRQNRLGIADLAFPSERAHADVIDALLASGLVRFAEPQFRGSYTEIPNDAQFPNQWALANTGQSGGTVGSDVRATDAWDIEDGDPSVVVAVLDSGSDWTHADLAAAIWDNTDETLNGADDDGNGYVDDVRGWDFPNNDNDPNGAINHGTSVASVIGAVSGNGLDMAGLAGGAVDGQGATVMPLNVGSFGPDASILDDAILYAVDNGARVITMSLVVPASSAIDAALVAAENAGVFVDCASGNNGFGVSYPATRPEVMAVASSNRFHSISGFSNQGPEVEVAAPGEDVLMLNLNSGTLTSSGTSFAAPHVAAAAALAFSLRPELTAPQVRTLIQDTARDMGASPNAQGSGLLDVTALLQAVQNLTQAEVVAFGDGLAGAGGVTPLITTRGGLPFLGNADFAVALASAAPSSNAVLVASFADFELPFKGGTLYVNPLPPGKMFSSVTGLTGRALVNAPLPEDPALDGMSVFTQWAVFDQEAPAGFALSGALELILAE